MSKYSKISDEELDDMTILIFSVNRNFMVFE